MKKEEELLSLKPKTINTKSLIGISLLLILTMTSSIFAQSDLEKGIQLFKDNKYQEAKPIFESCVKSNLQNAEAHYYLGRVYFQEQDFEKALDSFEQAVQYNNARSAYHRWLGHANGRMAQKAGALKKLGYAKKCKASYEKAVELDPSSIETRNSLLDYYLNAPGIVGGSKEKAAQQAAAIKNLDRMAGHGAYIRIYEHQKKYDLVEKEIREALTEDPNNQAMKIQLGLTLVNQQKYDDAFKHFEKMIVDSPQGLNAYYQIGRTAALSGQNLDRGIECLKYYLSKPEDKNLNPHAAAHWRLGLLYEHKKDKTSAVNEYREALKLNPNFKQARDALKKLK